MSQKRSPSGTPDVRQQEPVLQVGPIPEKPTPIPKRASLTQSPVPVFPSYEKVYVEVSYSYQS